MSAADTAIGAKETPAHGVSFGAALRVWARVAALSFGGPAGQIAVMHRIIVDEKGLVGERRFLHALSYCMLLPGPEATQLAIYIGWLMHRWPGGIAAGGLFVLPGIVALMALSWIYALYGQVPVIAALFFGLKAAVLAIVLYAVYRVGSRALKSGAMIAVGGHKADKLHNHDQGTRRRLGHAEPVEHLAGPEPAIVLDRLLRHVGEHRIGAAKGDDRHLREEQPDLAEGVAGAENGDDRDDRGQPQREPERRDAQGAADGRAGMLRQLVAENAVVADIRPSAAMP